MEWRDIPGYEGHYQASDDGQIKSLSRVVKFGRRSTKIIQERILKPTTDRYGYKKVSLGNRNYMQVHHLIMLAFVGPRPDHLCVNHIDGNKANNSLSNLEYCTWSKNNQHAYDTGLNKRGEQSAVSKLTEAQVREIKQRGKYDTYRNIGKDYGVYGGTINSIFQNDTWAHIPWPDGKEPTHHHGKVTKLTRKQVEEIKQLGKYTTYKEIAKKYGVWDSSIRDIFHNKTWTDVPWPNEEKGA